MMAFGAFGRSARMTASSTLLTFQFSRIAVASMSLCLPAQAARIELMRSVSAAASARICSAGLTSTAVMGSGMFLSSIGRRSAATLTDVSSSALRGRMLSSRSLHFLTTHKPLLPATNVRQFAATLSPGRMYSLEIGSAPIDAWRPCPPSPRTKTWWPPSVSGVSVPE